MRPKNYKGSKCIKRRLSKCDEVVKTYDPIQTSYADTIEQDEQISSFKCNVPIETDEDKDYTTDFLCTKSDGEYFVRECVYKRKLAFPRTCKLLDKSREYWAKRGITDWGIIVEKE